MENKSNISKVGGLKQNSGKVGWLKIKVGNWGSTTKY